MKKNPLIWLAGKIRSRIPMVVLLTIFNIAHALLGVFFALGSRGVIDSAVSADKGRFLHACTIQAYIILGILLCLALMRHLQERLRADLERDWKQNLLHGLLHGEYAAIKEYHSAELLNRLNNDVTKINDGILAIVPSTAAMVTKVGAAIVVLGILDLRFTVLILIVGLLVFSVTGFMRKKLKDLNKTVSAQDGKVSGFLQEIMEKLLMVQAMDASNEVESRADILLEARYQMQQKRKNVSLMTNMGVSIFSYGAGFIALIWGANRLLQGQISFGSLTAIIQLVNQVKSPFVNLSGIFPLYIAMMASAERLMELDAIQGEPVPCSEDPVALYSKATEIIGRNLSFAYDRESVLRDAEFVLPKGAFAVITGPSGIGKSTLLKLMLGIFQPEAGKICLDCGEESLTLDRSTRKLFAYVPQGNLLLSGSLRDNLTIVKPDATEVEFRQAIYISNMEDVISSLPDGLDTVLGESGGGLSEGQAQRLAIARAVLGGAPILLLDECTSALDEETEKIVLHRLRDLPDRTCIAVTHRSAAMEVCDWKLEIQNGKIKAIKMK